MPHEFGATNHWLFERNEWWWRFYELSFQGGQDYLDPAITTTPLSRTVLETADATPPTDRRSRHRSMLFSFPREENADFVARLDRARYDNWCRKIVAEVAGRVLDDNPPTREGVDAISDYLEMTDLEGNDRDSFMRRCVLTSQIFGHAYVLTEIPDVGVVPANRAQAEAVGQRVYSRIFTPLEVPNWSVNLRGEFEFIVLSSQVATGAGPFSAGGDSREMRRVYYPDRWEDWEVNGDSGSAVKVAEGSNPLGRVPVDVIYNQRDVTRRDPHGVSRIESPAQLNRALFNMSSLLDEQLYEQTFGFLAVPSTSADAMKKMVIGIKRWLGFREAGGAPQYVAPPDGPTRTLREVIGELETKLKAVAGMGRGVAEDSIAARPAEALEFEGGGMMAEVRSVRREAEAFERRNLATVAEWLGLDATAFRVVYPLGQDVGSDDAAADAGADAVAPPDMEAEASSEAA